MKKVGFTTLYRVSLWVSHPLAPNLRSWARPKSWSIVVPKNRGKNNDCATMFGGTQNDPICRCSKATSVPLGSCLAPLEFYLASMGTDTGPPLWLCEIVTCLRASPLTSLAALVSARQTISRVSLRQPLTCSLRVQWLRRGLDFWREHNLKPCYPNTQLEWDVDSNANVLVWLNVNLEDS